MRGNADGSRVWFDPIGVLIKPGQTLRWINVDAGNSHTSTAYHPKNDNHSLRIPEGAQPWNSDYLFPNEHFEVTLTAEGVYDYFCMPHEMAGMVGRIIVTKPTGPGTRPFDYFKNSSTGHTWQPLPEAAQEAFPTIESILRQRIVRRS